MQAAEVEDIYGLTPMQTGILYHALHAGDRGMYAQQGSCTIDGSLDLDRLRECWQSAVDTFGALRTCFRWAGLERPVQIVLRRADLPFQILDWRVPGDAAGWRARLDTLLEEDLATGFELRQAPLMRVSVAILGDNSHRLIWSYHHIVLDAWSEAIVLRHVMGRYGGAGLDPSPSFRQHVSWLERWQASRMHREIWSRYLAGYSHRPLPRCAPHAPAASHTITRAITGDIRSALTRGAAALRATPGALMLALWSLWVAARSGSDDVVIGVTMSGRDEECPGVERQVGLLFVTLPVRIRVQQQMTFADLVRGIQRDWAMLLDHQHTPLHVIRDCVPSSARGLFDAVMVFLNADLQIAERRLGAAVIADVQYRSRTNYPLTFRVVDGLPMLLEVVADPRYLAPGEGGDIISYCERALQRLDGATDCLVGDLQPRLRQKRFQSDHVFEV